MEKLESRNGVSIVFALLFLLIAAFAVSASLGAATAAAAQTAHERVWQQDHLSLVSAAELLSACMEETEVCVASEQTTFLPEDAKAEDEQAEPPVTVSSVSITLAEPCPLASTLGAALLDAVESGSARQGRFEIVPEENPAGDRLKAVSVTYTVTPAAIAGFQAEEESLPVQLSFNYRLFAQLAVGNGEEGGQTLYLLADSRSAPISDTALSEENVRVPPAGEPDMPDEVSVTIEQSVYGITWERAALSTRREQLRKEAKG